MKSMAKRLAKTGYFPAIRRWLHSCFRWRWFRGRHANWAAARAASVGYDDGAVLLRAQTAARAVRSGQAKWERDGAWFADPVIHFPLLDALLKTATGDGHLRVVDFGGAFGSTWWQHRAELAVVGRVDWRVVEQAAFVEIGRREFTDGVVGFYPTIGEACEGVQPPALLLSSVLQYIEAPWQLLADWASRGFDHIIIDRTPFAIDGQERLVVQHTPPGLGGGSYPCWIFNRDRLLAPLAARFELISEWPGFDDVDPQVEFRGFHFRRKKDGSA